MGRTELIHFCSALRSSQQNSDEFGVQYPFEEQPPPPSNTTSALSPIVLMKMHTHTQDLVMSILHSITRDLNVNCYTTTGKDTTRYTWPTDS